MSYRSILVNLDIDDAIEPLTGFAVELAKTFDARLVGLTAADMPMPIVTTEGMVLDGGFIEDQQREIEGRIAAAEAEFKRLTGGIKAEWRSGVFNPTRFLIEASRAADLIVTASQAGADNLNRAIDIGSVALHAGRPLLVAASESGHPVAGKALVAWKDSREARRAVADAMPLLIHASEVVVATVDRDSLASTAESLADVAGYLGSHGIKARTELLAEKDDAHALINLAHSMRADLLVSGAYGHSRLREWVFGGVTNSLLKEAALNRFVSG